MLQLRKVDKEQIESIISKMLKRDGAKLLKPKLFKLFITVKPEQKGGQHVQ